MRSTLFLAVFITLCVASNAEASYPSWVYDAFEAWSIQWDKNFDSSPSEKEYRVGVFYTNLKYIEETNAAQDSYKLGLNGFSAMTVDEFLSSHTGLLPKEIQNGGDEAIEEVEAEIPDSVDWVAKGAVTGVKNQGQCGSCWAFSTTGGLEGQKFVAQGALVSMSEQQLVDCSGGFGNYGCDGGEVDWALRYVMTVGIQSEESYLYHPVQGTCKYNASAVVFNITGIHDIPKRSKTAFLDALQGQPVSIAIDAEKIMSYISGVFDDKNCGNSLDHAVLAVGYDQTQGFINVKNSWGTTWGENGYIRFVIRENGSGECGMYLDSSYPTV